MEKALEVFFKELKGVGVEITQGVTDLTVYAYPILVRQQTIIGIITLLAVIVSIAGFLISLARTKEWESPTGAGISTIIFGFSSIFALTMFFADGLPKLLNPEYYAMMTILNLITGY